MCGGWVVDVEETGACDVVLGCWGFVEFDRGCETVGVGVVVWKRFGGRVRQMEFGGVGRVEGIVSVVLDE